MKKLDRFKLIQFTAIICITIITGFMIVSLTLLTGLSVDGEIGLDAAVLTISLNAIVQVATKIKKGDKDE